MAWSCLKKTRASGGSNEVAQRRCGTVVTDSAQLLRENERSGKEVAYLKKLQA
jgi:hypothetical protein